MYGQTDEPSSESFEQMIQGARNAIQSKRGWFRKIPKHCFLAGTPSSGDPLTLQWTENQRLLSKGTVVWGSLVQANKVLFQLHEDSAPGEVICSHDTYFDSRPNELGAISQSIASMKGTLPSDGKLREIADDITDEMTRSMAKPVPQTLVAQHSGGSRVVRFSTWFDRKHLPEGVLAQSLIPLLIHPQCKVTTMLPAYFWPEELRQFWSLSESQLAALQQQKRERQAKLARLPLIVLTESAQNALTGYAEGASEIVLRVGIDQGSFSLNLISRQEITPSDETVQVGQTLVVVQKSQVPHIRGTEIDFGRSGNLEGFQFNSLDDS
ncbi:MAG: hypothetical protein AAFX06_27810 [Planctomycetota bacterium]